MSKNKGQNKMPTNNMPNMKAPESKDLGVPSHEEEAEEAAPESEVEPKAEAVNLEKNDSMIKSPSAPKNGIEVVATRKGFYRQHRKREGDKFKVRSLKELGQWMVCVDPLREKERLEMFKKKKAL